MESSRLRSNCTSDYRAIWKQLYWSKEKDDQKLDIPKQNILPEFLLQSFPWVVEVVDRVVDMAEDRVVGKEVVVVDMEEGKVVDKVVDMVGVGVEAVGVEEVVVVVVVGVEVVVDKVVDMVEVVVGKEVDMVVEVVGRVEDNHLLFLQDLLLLLRMLLHQYFLSEKKRELFWKK